MTDFTYTSNSKPLEPLDVKELIAMLEKAGQPQGLVMLPGCRGIDVYQFPATLLKGAISFMQCQWNPPQQKSPTAGQEEE